MALRLHDEGNPSEATGEVVPIAELVRHGMALKHSVHVSHSAFDHGLEELYRSLRSDCRQLAKSQDVWWQLWYHTVVQML